MGKSISKHNYYVKWLVLAVFLMLLMGKGATIQSQAKVTLSSVKTASGGKFEKKGSKWRYKMADGTYAPKGLLNINGKYYYFSKKGYRLSGWQTIQKESFYFGTASQGYMYRNKFAETDKGIFYLKKDGRKTIGWKTISGKQYYFDANGKAVTGRKKIKGIYYNFSKKGVLLSSGAKLSIASDCAILIEAESGKVIFEKNADKRRANASTTKIMTCILALERGNLKDTVQVSANAAGQEPSKLYMTAGDSFVLKDLLYSLMLPSHNDTAVAIAEHIGKTTAKFADMMNAKAKELGCTNTHFVTPNGLDNDTKGHYYDHYSSARDMAKIAQYAMKNETFLQLVGTTSYSFKSKKGRSYSVTTTNALLNSLVGTMGIKTGYTNKAGYCFVGGIKAANGKTYISVVLGASTSANRWADSRKMLEYAYKLKK